MRFHVRNRANAERCNPIDVPHVIISINSSHSDLANVKQNEFTVAIRPWVFDDLDREPGPSYIEVYGEPELFSREHAEEIISFVEKHVTNIKAVVVHCDAGYSRSPGVAAALALIHNNDDREFWDNSGRMYGSPRYDPNRFVYHTILNVWQDKSR